MAYVAYVAVDDGAGSTWSCTGSVIAPSWVLTAAHCVSYDPSDLVRPNGLVAATVFRVAIGDGDAGTRNDWGAVERVERIPFYYVVSGHWDVALLHMTVPSGIVPIDLAPSNDSGLTASGTPATIAGWGLTAQSPVAGTRLLRTGATAITPADVCATAWGTVYNDRGELCTGSFNTTPAPCFGDSGGPVVVNDAADGNWPYLVGDVAFRDVVCVCLPAVSTRIVAYRDWIVGVVGYATPTLASATQESEDCITSGLGSTAYYVG